MARTPISKEDFNDILDRGRYYNNNHLYFFKDKIFDFDAVIYNIKHDIIFDNCQFKENLHFKSYLNSDEIENTSDEVTASFYLVENPIIKSNITFRNNCEFLQKLSFKDLILKGKVRFHNCILNNVDFNNTTFNDLADFWNTKFKKPIVFYKTDFKSTTVFSFAIFYENILFTYTLLSDKTIFAKTEFKKGLDISQAVIKGDLQLFDLKFDFNKYDTEYIVENHADYQVAIDSEAIIPLENKVHTFQILKKGFIDIGNYSDSILMQREEKRALRELTQKRLKDNNVDEVNRGDKAILWLNRWSNHYQSDFRNGIWFTFIVAVVFGFMTLVFTEAFQRNICICNGGFSEHAFSEGVKFLFNFLNPTRSITHLEHLEPTFFGMAYLFDFLGRIAVGYGFYQTIQAFRKFK